MMMRPIIKRGDLVPMYKHIQCGDPVLAEEIKFKGAVDLNGLLISSNGDALVLYIPHSGLEAFEIFEGDFLIIHFGLKAKMNDLIFCLDGDEQVLRTFRKGDKNYWLVTAILQPRWKLYSEKMEELLLHSSRDLSFFPHKENLNEIHVMFNLNHLMPRLDDTILLEVKGESMIEKQIRNGDWVLIDKTIKCESGDVIAAFVEGGYTLKVYDGKEYIKRLVPANSKFKEILVWDRNAKSEGVVIGRIRRLKKW